MGRFLAVALSVIVVAASGVGLCLVGGPQQARQATLDMERLQRMTVIVRTLGCETYENTSLPDTLSPETVRGFCKNTTLAAAALLDHESGKPYVFTRLNDREFTLGGDVHDADAWSAKIKDTRRFQNYDFDPSSGCLTQ